jgi:hypothetical protein
VTVTILRYQTMTPDQVAAFREELEHDSSCPVCGDRAAIVEVYERGPNGAGTLYLHGVPVTGQPAPVPSCWVPA